MAHMPSGDPYIENVLRHVPPDVARTLTRKQWNGFRQAMRSSAKPSRHSVDVRFVIPLYFVRLYFVLLIGKDRRRRVHDILSERRHRARRHAVALFLAVAFLVVLVFVLLVLYVLKSAAGINIFPNFHLGDWLPFQD